jgi:ubiquinone/menaquinone biosynthesis C-methylase UbiE
VTIPVEARFEKVADLYDKYRPGYPDAVVDWFQLPDGARVLDLGCGTGISARLFAKRGYHVVAIDPNEAMLEKARAHGGDVTYAVGRAEATGQPAASFDLAYAAQAFHWFDIDSSMRELRRVLAPNGRAAAIWNLRAPTLAMREYEELLRTHSHEYAQLERPEQTIERIRESDDVIDVVQTEIDNAQVFDWDGLHGRAHSSSYVAHGVDDKQAFDRALLKIYDRYAVDGRFPFDYRTHVLTWRIR